MAKNPLAVPSAIVQWGPVFRLSNVAIHAHLLPTGKVLYWGRRFDAGSTHFNTLNEHNCSSFLWDPVSLEDTPTAQPSQLRGGEGVNLFCSGHSFQPDGSLLVAGGHLFDSEGVNQACVYDAFADTWTALDVMNDGRWYPSCLTLPDGGVFVISGSYIAGRSQPSPDNPTGPIGAESQVNINPEIWRGGPWVSTENFNNLPLFPRLHVEPKLGHVFMAGPLGQSFSLDIGTSTWTPGSMRIGQLRDYAPSVMYESGKILFIGGGQDATTQVPTNIAEIIDLNDPAPAWKQTGSMTFPRRQHNATVLPDGSVLVTGGTQGVANEPQWRNFNNLEAPAPVHQAELWSPNTGNANPTEWMLMAEETKDRCYHSTALLLPDGRVLSAGGGAFDAKDPTDNASSDQPNPPHDSHQDAQLFSATVPLPGGIPANHLRSPAINHSCIILESQQVGTNLTVTAPLNPNIAPPGHYMLFVLNGQGVPSKAPIIQLAVAAGNIVLTQQASTRIPRKVNLASLSKKIAIDEPKLPVIVGVTPSCPCGIGACWGGALGGLQQLENVKVVRPIPDTVNSLAFVYLEEDRLPDLDAWREQFAAVVNGIYIIRGVEMKISGLVTQKSIGLTLAGTTSRPALVLAPQRAADKVQWDIKTRDHRPMSDMEAGAFDQLVAALVDHPRGLMVEVAGPLVNGDQGFRLRVREFQIPNSGLGRQAGH